MTAIARPFQRLVNVCDFSTVTDGRSMKLNSATSEANGLHSPHMRKLIMIWSAGFICYAGAFTCITDKMQSSLRARCHGQFSHFNNPHFRPSFRLTFSQSPSFRQTLLTTPSTTAPLLALPPPFQRLLTNIFISSTGIDSATTRRYGQGRHRGAKMRLMFSFLLWLVISPTNAVLHKLSDVFQVDMRDPSVHFSSCARAARGSALFNPDSPTNDETHLLNKIWVQLYQMNTRVLELTEPDKYDSNVDTRKLMFSFFSIMANAKPAQGESSVPTGFYRQKFDDVRREFWAGICQ